MQSAIRRSGESTSVCKDPPRRQEQEQEQGPRRGSKVAYSGTLT